MLFISCCRYVERGHYTWASESLKAIGKKKSASYKSLTLLMGNKEQEIIFGRSLQKRCEQRLELTHR